MVSLIKLFKCCKRKWFLSGLTSRNDHRQTWFPVITFIVIPYCYLVITWIQFELAGHNNLGNNIHTCVKSCVCAICACVCAHVCARELLIERERERVGRMRTLWRARLVCRCAVMGRGEADEFSRLGVDELSWICKRVCAAQVGLCARREKPDACGSGEAKLWAFMEPISVVDSEA